MRKIASPGELQGELRRLLAYSQGSQPSREKLAVELRALANRVAAAKLKKLPGYGATQQWAVMDGDKTLGWIEKNRSTKTSLYPYHAYLGEPPNDKKSVGHFYDKKESEKHGPQLNEETVKKMKWGGLDAAMKAIEGAA